MPDDDAIDTGGLGAPLAPGTAVEVRNRLSDRWIAGFRVETVRPDGYRLRRAHDHAVLPTVFPPSTVRAER